VQPTFLLIRIRFNDLNELGFSLLVNRGAADLCIIWIDVLIALTRVRELVCGRTTTTTARENHSARCGTIAPERNEKMYLTPQVVEWSLERSTTFSFVYSIYIYFSLPPLVTQSMVGGCLSVID